MQGLWPWAGPFSAAMARIRLVEGTLCLDARHSFREWCSSGKMLSEGSRKGLFRAVEALDLGNRVWHVR